MTLNTYLNTLNTKKNSCYLTLYKVVGHLQKSPRGIVYDIFYTINCNKSRYLQTLVFSDIKKSKVYVKL